MLPLGWRLLHQVRTHLTLQLPYLHLLGRRHLLQLHPRRLLLVLHMGTLNQRVLHLLLHVTSALNLLARRRLLSPVPNGRQVARLQIVGSRRLRSCPQRK